MEIPEVKRRGCGWRVILIGCLVLGVPIALLATSGLLPQTARSGESATKTADLRPTRTDAPQPPTATAAPSEPPATAQLTATASSATAVAQATLLTALYEQATLQAAATRSPGMTAIATPQEQTTGNDATLADFALVYSSAENGQQPVLGPIEMPSGDFIVTVTTDSRLSADVQTLSGECRTPASSLFDLSSGQASDRAEALFSSEGCEMLLSISDTLEPWTLTILPFSPTADVRDPADVLTSADEGLESVVGPILLADGIWRVTATTDGYLITKIKVVTGTCETSSGSLFTLRPGQASQGAEAAIVAQDCSILIVTYNVTTPWTLEFEQMR